MKRSGHEHSPAKSSAAVRATSRTVRSDSPTQENLLQQSQVFDISQDAIFLWRVPGGIEFWNRGATELYGYTQEEALGRISHDLLQTQYPIPLAEIEEQLRTKGTWEGELRHRTHSGEERIVFSRFQVAPNRGEGMLVLESTRDITQARRNEEQLRGRLREQAVLGRFSFDALQATSIQTICDDATHILVRELGVDFSALFELSADEKTMTLRAGEGWKPGHVGKAKIDIGEETVTGRALHLNQPIIIEDVRADRQLRVPEFMNDHQVASSMAVVIQGRDRAFGVLSVDTRARRTFNANDVHFLEAIGNVLATAISRIQFEHELRDTSGRLRGIVDTAVDGIITINEQGIVETMNPAAERIFGYGAAEVVGRNISMLMPEPYHSEHDGYIDRYRRTGERRIIGIGREVRGRRKDGTEFPMDLAVSATMLGERRIFTGFVRDITARKELEQEILEISDHEQRRIGSDLHDDLCQRLASLRFFCDALRKTISASQLEEGKTKLDKIGAGLGDAIDRTRMLARGLAPVALETNGLISALEELTQGINTLFNVKCKLKAKGKIQIRDPIAATHLFRITQEAINNALKHAQTGEITVSVETGRDKNLLTIADNGIGFSPPETQRTAQGMGLRTIAYRAGMINADVQVQSALGRGTKIIVAFPSDL